MTSEVLEQQGKDLSSNYLSLTEKEFREKFRENSKDLESIREIKLRELFTVAVSFGDIIEKELIQGLKNNSPSEVSQFRIAELFAKYEALVSSLLMIAKDKLTVEKDPLLFEDINKFTALLLEQATVSLSKAEFHEKTENGDSGKNLAAKIAKGKTDIQSLQQSFLSSF